MNPCKKITVSLVIFVMCLSAVHSQDMAKIEKLTEEITEITNRAIARGGNLTPQEQARVEEIRREFAAESEPLLQQIKEEQRQAEQEAQQKHQEDQKRFEEKRRQEEQRWQEEQKRRTTDSRTNRAEYNDSGVVINGVKWATRNVGNRGAFVAQPESAGTFFQWNRPMAWSATEDWVDDWDYTNVESSIWEKSNDPCPAGWRIPSGDDINKLVDANKVNIKFTTVNGVEGIQFSDKVSGGTIFLPMQGYRIDNSGRLYGSEDNGNYWSRSVDFLKRPYYLTFNNRGSAIRGFGRENGDATGFCVRCVSE